MLSISNNYFSSLPNEVTEKILKKVEIKDFYTISRVSSVFANHVKNLLESEVITKSIYTVGIELAVTLYKVAGGVQGDKILNAMNAVLTQEKIHDVIRVYTFEELEGAKQTNLQMLETLKTMNVEKMQVQDKALKIRSDFNATPIGGSFNEKETIMNAKLFQLYFKHLCQ